MWALLDQNNIVIACVPPDATTKQLNELQKENKLIEMTLENSPATIGYFYDGQKFCERIE
jgi:hypothetical protein